MASYRGMNRPNFGAQVSGGGVPNTGTPTQPNAWGPTQTFGPGYTGPNPGMGPKPIGTPNGTDNPAGGPSTLGGPQTYGPGYTGPNPGMPPKPIGTPNGTDNPAGGPNTLTPFGQPAGFKPLPMGGTGPANPHYGSTGTWSSGRNAGVMAFDAPPAINQQTTTTASTPNVSANPYAQFTSSNNLLGAQITPQKSDRLNTAQGYTSSAAGNLAGYSQKPFQGVGAQDASGTYAQLARGNDQMQGMGTAGYRSVAGTDLSGAQGFLDAASRSVNPSAAASGMAGAGQMGGFSYAGDTQGLRGTTMGQLDKTLNNTPDRAKLASDAYQQLLERSAPMEQTQDRRLAQRTAAMGRAGSGMFNSEQMDLATARERERDLARRSLATDAAGLSLQDQMDKLNASRGVTSDFSGYDTAAGSLNLGYQNSNNAERGNAFNRTMALEGTAFDRNRALSSDSVGMAQIRRNDGLTERDAMNDAERYGNDLTQRRAAASRQYGMDQYGIGRDARGDAVNERDTSMAYDQQGFNNSRSQFGDLSSYEDMIRQNERSDRNEVRGERGYQAGMDQRAIDNAERQRGMEDRYRNSDLGYAGDLMQYGYGSDPYGALASQGRRFDGQASDAYGATADLFGNWAQSRALGNQRTAPRPNAYAGV